MGMKILKDIFPKVSELAVSVGNFIKEEAKDFDLNRVELKGSKSNLVSYVDKGAEERIVEGLQKLIPDSGFLTEENTVAQQDKEFTWVIDPLDGTTNFVHGLPVYAVSIGLRYGDELVLGVIHEINRHETFRAYKGSGAFLNDTPIHVTPATQIDESLFATGFPIYNFEKLNDYLAILNQLMKNSHGLRRMGSAATDLAYVACGRTEGFFEYNLSPWDVAAGIVIVREAGGTVTNFSGGADALLSREIVAAGPVHKELLEVIQKFW